VSDAFASSLWWLDELGKMARRGTPVVVRQSLTGADYGLLAEPSLTPRPDYFASVLWRKLMGTRVLAAQAAPPTLRVYAHCAQTGSGAVTVLLINLDSARPASIALDGVDATGAELYAVAADSLTSATARLNGQPLAVDDAGALSPLQPSRGAIALEPESYAFVVLPRAGAAACR
jgi:hypothetical protein